MTDISSLKPVERIYEVLHPKTGAPLGVRVGLLSLDDERMKRVKRDIQNKAIEKQKRGKVFSADETDENTDALLKAAMTSWDWYDADINGRKPVFPDELASVFGDYPWFREQIAEQVGDTKSFLQG